MRYKSVAIGDEDYPFKLLTIKNPPEKLYYIGDISLANKIDCIGVVGARKASHYGRDIAKKIGKRFAENDIVTVSGMASGIDSCAHMGALEAGGMTIAVLGTGLDKCFPESNRKLKSEIEEKGLILSEYPEGFPGSKFSFPMRNRIISALSIAVVVVEAGIRSGSLITAELAAEQGRLVYAVPGNITNFMSMGTNQLIRDGAIAIATIDDIIEDMGMQKNVDLEEIVSLGKDERNIFDYVNQNGETRVDELAFHLGITPQNVCEIVTILEMKGILRTSMGKIFIAKCQK